MVITIPVKGGYKGGNVIVEHSNGERKSFQFDNESGRHSSLMAFYSDSSHELKPITSG